MVGFEISEDTKLKTENGLERILVLDLNSIFDFSVRTSCCGSKLCTRYLGVPAYGPNLFIEAQQGEFDLTDNVQLERGGTV